VTVSEGLAAFKAAGFELMHHEDLAARPDATPWYYPLAGELRYIGSVGDIFTIARMTWWGRGLVHKFVGFGEKIGVMPKGTQKTADSLAVAADNLVKGGKEHLFTPMYLMIGRKPLN
jgi:sterol 24-C-methyltransferase